MRGAPAILLIFDDVLEDFDKIAVLRLAGQAMHEVNDLSPHRCTNWLETKPALSFGFFQRPHFACTPEQPLSEHPQRTLREIAVLEGAVPSLLISTTCSGCLGRSVRPAPTLEVGGRGTLNPASVSTLSVGSHRSLDTSCRYLGRQDCWQRLQTLWAWRVLQICQRSSRKVS